MPWKKFKQCRRHNVPGDAHGLTFNCFRRQKFLESDRCCRWLADAIIEAKQKHEFDLWAYVFMPEHVHLVTWPTMPIYSVSKFLQSVKQSVTCRAVLWLRHNNPSGLARLADMQPNGKTHYRVWQRGGGHDRNLNTPAAIHAEIEYLHNNPVRRGLCKRPEDWFWSSPRDWLGLGPGPIPIVRTVPPLLPRAKAAN